MLRINKQYCFWSTLKIAFIYVFFFFAFQVVKGKDLPGAINVLPAGLGEVLKKRESREFKMEVNINNLVSMKYVQNKWQLAKSEIVRSSQRLHLPRLTIIDCNNICKIAKKYNIAIRKHYWFIHLHPKNLSFHFYKEI